MEYLPNILAALVIVFVGFVVGKFIEELLSSFSSRSGFGSSNRIGKSVKYFFLFICIVIAIGQIGINITFLSNLILVLLALLLFGAALAFGLGAGNTVNNILSSYYLQKTFHVGDKIQINSTIGEITKITATSVFLETEKGKAIVPAKDFSEKEIQIIERSEDEK